MPNSPKARTCPECGGGYRTTWNRQKYCSKTCSNRARAMRKSSQAHSPKKPTPRVSLPPLHLHGTDRIMDYAPPCSASLGSWLDALPDHQLSAVWKAVAVEQWGECNRADALSILQAVDRRFVKVTTDGRDRTSTRGNADPNRAA